MQKILFSLLVVLLLVGCAPQTNTPALENSTSVLPTDLPTAMVSALPTETNTSLPAGEVVSETSLPPQLPTNTPEPETPPGIILFIGDGMGTMHRQAATWLSLGEQGVLAMDSMPVHGSAITSSANNEITDSAAAATALATGHLTDNSYLGVDPDENLLVSILEMAQYQGWSVGLVTTTQLTHATPAAFAVHYPDRSANLEIARQLMNKRVDVLLGGGEDDFFSKDEAGCFKGNGKQPEDLVAQAIAAGYTYVCSGEELLSLDTSNTDQVLGLFAAEGMVRPFSPNLTAMTQTALEILSHDPDGFFLMVEGGQIDWASHDHDAETAMENVLGLDSAIALAQMYALDHPQTLIIVTADHETGGLSLNTDGGGLLMQDGPFRMPDDTLFWVDWALTGSHTSQPVTVTAQGPFSENLSGEYPLTKIYETMTILLLSQN
ncbi:alkaline phosphatase [bacterium]|nr:alkaline phosphatase [bacterium]